MLLRPIVLLIGLSAALAALPAEPIASPAASPASPASPASRLPASTGAGPLAAPSARPLPFHYDLYTFRGAADSTVVVAAFAVPVGSLQREVVAREVRYRFDVTLVVADTAERTVFRSDDSVFVRLPRPLAGEHLLSTHIAVHAPPSEATLQRVIMTDATTPGIGQLYSAAFPIPDYTGTDLMLSDIALTQPDSRSGWERGGVTLALLPTGEFPRSPFDVYYEVYNLPAGHEYTTEIAVERVADGRGRIVTDDRAVRVRYSGESLAGPDGTLAELRHVDPSVGDGRYRITVTVTDAVSGQSASRSRLFQVSGWPPGTTLVAALPRGDRRIRVRSH